MTRTIHRLQTRQAANARPPEGRTAATLADGGNLFLQVSAGKDGGVRRSWTFRYELDGRRHELGLGPLHTVSLAQAREFARELRLKIKTGVDPLTAKREQQSQRQLAAAKSMTFGQCADAYLAAHDAGWRNA